MLKRALPGYDTWRLVVVAGLAAGILLTACNRRTPLTAPPPSSRFAEADVAFRAGDYPVAARHYTSALASETGIDRERALFRLGLIHALPESPIRDPDQARSFLSRLVAEFPHSPYAVEVHTLIDLQSKLETLASRIAQLEIGIERQRREIGLQDEEIERRALEIEERTIEVQRLARQLDQASAELEKLKEIDLGRRRSN